MTSKIIISSLSLAVFVLSTYQLCLDQTYYYHSPQPIHELKAKMQKMFDFNRNNLISSNLSGKFINQNEFEVQPKISFVVIKNSFGDTRVIYLKGSIRASSPNTSEVTFTSKPNATFYILPMIFSIFIFFAFFDKDKYTQNDTEKLETTTNFTIVSIFLIIVPIICFSMSYAVQHSLINTFISTFGLTIK